MASISLQTSLADVYDRDRGICHLCRKFVPLREASRDHIITKNALKGVDHQTKSSMNSALQNFALAHRLCNSMRGHAEIENEVIIKVKPLPTPKRIVKHWRCQACTSLNAFPEVKHQLDERTIRIHRLCSECKTETVFFVDKELGIQVGPLVFLGDKI